MREANRNALCSEAALVREEEFWLVTPSPPFCLVCILRFEILFWIKSGSRLQSAKGESGEVGSRMD